MKYFHTGGLDNSFHMSGPSMMVALEIILLVSSAGSSSRHPIRVSRNTEVMDSSAHLSVKFDDYRIITRPNAHQTR